MSNIILPGKREPTLQELEAQYSKKKSEELRQIHDRFKIVQRQAKKRCRAAMNVLAFRARDNGRKPPTQIIRPCALRASIVSRQ